MHSPAHDACAMLRIQFLTSTEVADQLGLSRSQVNRLAAQGKLPAVKVGGVWLFDPRKVRSVTPHP